MRVCCAGPTLYTNVVGGTFQGTTGPFPGLRGVFLVDPCQGSDFDRLQISAELQPIAKAVPISLLKPAAPLPGKPTVLDNTGNGGERPQPPYPKIALTQGQEGAVGLRMMVDEGGVITAIDVDQSSGFPVLDRSALDFVRRHWIVPPGKGSRMYEVTINYKLQRG